MEAYTLGDRQQLINPPPRKKAPPYKRRGFKHFPKREKQTEELKK